MLLIKFFLFHKSQVSSTDFFFFLKKKKVQCCYRPHQSNQTQHNNNTTRLLYGKNPLHDQSEKNCAFFLTRVFFALFASWFPLCQLRTEPSSSFLSFLIDWVCSFPTRYEFSRKAQTLFRENSDRNFIGFFFYCFPNFPGLFDITQFVTVPQCRIIGAPIWPFSLRTPYLYEFSSVSFSSSSPAF